MKDYKKVYVVIEKDTLEIQGIYTANNKKTVLDAIVETFELNGFNERFSIEDFNLIELI